MSEPQYTAESSRPRMKRWKKVVIGVVVLAVLVGVGGPLLYKLLNPAAKKATDELDQRRAAATVPASLVPTASIGASVAADASTPAPAVTTGGTAAPASVVTEPTTASSAPAGAGSLDGTWKVQSTNDVKTLYVGYRVNEVLAGQKVTATGRTPSVTGSLTVAGTKVPTAEFTAQMATVKSDKDQRDQQYNGRIMETSKFPTATFTLTSPIDFTAVPAGNAKVTASATGNLTLHGVTKPVTFDISGFVSGSEMTIAGEIPVTFADYGITNPSFGPVTTEDHGALEFLLVLDKA